MRALDGNAMAGRLMQALGADVTGARGVCGACGTAGVVAEMAVFMDAPGAVARCPACTGVLIVLVEVRGMACVDLSGLAELVPREGA